MDATTAHHRTTQQNLPEDDALSNELAQHKYKIVNSDGTIRLEEKEEMKRRLGKSPDLADRLVLRTISLRRIRRSTSGSIGRVFRTAA